MKRLNPDLPISLARIAWKVYPGDPMSHRRLRPNVDARVAVAMQLMRRGYTTVQIGAFFGINHSTVVHYKSKHADLIQFDLDYRTNYNKFLKLLIEANLEAKMTEVEIKDEIKRITREVLALGYTPAQVDDFWKECINEIK